MPKVFVPSDRSCYVPHKSFGEICTSLKEFERNPEKFSLLVLPGGADIQPSIYGHEPNPRTSTRPLQDEYELHAIDIAMKHGIPIAGICRGAQMLIAKAGGYLYQHVAGHHGSHQASTYDGQNFIVSSCHHQMFGWPLPEGSQLIAWSSEKLSNVYELSKGLTGSPPLEPECVYIPELKALATQWHPEWMSENQPGSVYYQFLLETLLRPEAAKRFGQLKV